MITLGGNIELTGFRELDKGELSVVKKMVGNYVKRFNDLASNFEKLKLTMRAISQTPKSEIYEINAQVIDNGQTINAEHSDRNLFFCIDRVLKKIENSFDVIKGKKL
ncbi:hypothetical protein DRJ17_01280 [Candidatus Woesearchaeota archaeon]|nr:MAG: hypothetical protein DRJ17_01280 [Candidatus Woesearchaeota archaeon]